MNTDFKQQRTAADYYFFGDEVELQKGENSELTFFFFGVLVPFNKVEAIEQQIKTILQPLGTQKFHSKKTYRQEYGPLILQELSNLILREQLHCICFPFVASWMDRPELAVLKSFTLPGMPEVTPDNYRSQAWLLFLHVLNHHIKKFYPIRCFNLVLDKDWLKVTRYVTHEGIKLDRLGQVYSSTAKKDPLLVLADHIGYLFQNLKRYAVIEDGDIHLKPEASLIAAGAVALHEKLLQQHLWHYLDLWRWIEEENTREK